MIRGQTASVLVLALIVAFVLSALGLSLAMVARGESEVARNEKIALQALHAAEATARVVRGWFDRPGSGLGFPLDPAVIRRERAILDESDPYGSGAVAGPQYKEEIDLDGDGADDLFCAPYGGGIEHSLLGREQAPDMRIDDRFWLDRLSRSLFGGDPDLRSGLRISIRRIDIFAPPYVRKGAGWSRRGMGTIEATVGVDRIVDGEPEGRLAERSIRMVLRELPYTSGIHGPLHVCGDLRVSGELAARWGTVTATGDVWGASSALLPWSLPRAWADDPGRDSLWTEDREWIDSFNAKVDPVAPVPDPWLRLIAGGDLEGAGSDEGQPFAEWPPPPNGPPPWRCCDGSNVMQRHGAVGCPAPDYEFWKAVATAGVAGAHYFAWSPLGGFSEDGAGPVGSFREILAGAGPAGGLYFFDTIDGHPPRDDDGDGAHDNLTPGVVVGGDWAATGFVYLNATSFRADGLTPVAPVAMSAPGEPALADGTAWIDLLYPWHPDGAVIPGGSREWNGRGPEAELQGSFQGILFVRGSFRARRGGLFYGSVVSGAGADLDGATHPSPRLYWDASLADAAWPPAEWNLPRVVPAGVSTGP